MQFIELQNTNAGDKELLLLVQQHSERVEHLYLDHSRVSDRGLEALRSCRRLKTLTCHSTRVTSRGLRVVADLEALEELGIANTPVDDTIAETFSRIPQLRSLDVSGTAIGDAALAKLIGFTALQALHLDDVRISAACLSQLLALPSLTELSLRRVARTLTSLERITSPQRLERLNLFAVSLQENAAAAFLGSLNRLERLDLEGCAFSRLCFETMAALPRLSELDLSRSNVDDSHCEVLKCGAYNYLDVSETMISSPGVATLLDKRLWHGLNLSGTYVDDDGLAAIAEQSKLEMLSLKNTVVTDQCIDHLAKVPAIGLDVRRTRLSVSGIVRLAEISGARWIHCDLPRDVSSSKIVLSAAAVRPGLIPG